MRGATEVVSAPSDNEGSMGRAGKIADWRNSAGHGLQLVKMLWSQRLFPAVPPVADQPTWTFWGCLAVLIVVAGAIFLPNRAFPLFEPDEGRRAEISREILTNKDWVVCTLNQQPYYDKPPLFHWLVALSFYWFGTDVAAARLVPGLVAIFTVLTTFVLGRRMLGQRAAFLGGLALALMGGYTVAGRLVGLDGTLTLFMAAALLTAHEAVQNGQLRWRWWLASAALCGLGVLTKGPVALVLLAPPLALHIWLSADGCRLRARDIMAYAAVLAAVVTPWVVLVLLRDPRMLYQFLLEHNLQRFALGIAHDEPWWYYLPVLSIACLPWSPLMPFFLRHLCRMEPEYQARRVRPLGFVLLWATWCVLFFSISRGKLPLYIMPALPAFALLTGWFLEQLLWQAAAAWQGRFLRTILPRLMLLMVCGCWAGACCWAWRAGLATTASAVAVGAVTATVMVAVLVARPRRLAWLRWVLCAAMMLCLNIDLGQRLVPALARSRAPLVASREARRLARSGQAAVACPGQEWASITFACQGEIFDSDAGTPQQLLRFLDEHPLAFVMIGKGKFEWLRQKAPWDYRFTVLQESQVGVVVLTQRGS